MLYDVFICHASEDKEDIARPLADELKNCGLKVWYDEFTLKLGDSLRRSIDSGLVNSSYGVVIISPNFMNKEWPKKELDGLVAREAGGQKLILPIWHNIGPDEVRQYSPTLADRIAITSSSGINYIVRKILESIDFQLKKRIGLDLFHGQLWDGLIDLLTSNGVEPVSIDNKINNRLLNSIDILFIAMDGLNTQKTFDVSEVENIHNFVYDGGILICADQAWSWVDSKYGNKPLHTLPLNVLGKRLGFLITEKNVEIPEYFFSEIMSGIKNLERKTNWAPSEIEFQAQNAHIFMREKRNKVVGGYFELGRGLVFVVGHKSILEENPKVILNIFSYSAQKKYSNKNVFHSNILEEIMQYKTNLINSKDENLSAKKLGDIAITHQETRAICVLWEAICNAKNLSRIIDACAFTVGRIILESSELPIKLENICFDIFKKSTYSKSELIIDKFAFTVGKVVLEARLDRVKQRAVDFINTYALSSDPIVREKYIYTKDRIG